MPRATELDLETIDLAQSGRVLTATIVAPPLNFVTPAVVRDLDLLTMAADTDDTVGAIVLTGGLPGRFLQELAAFLSTGSSKAATRTQDAFFDDLARLGDTPFLAEPKAWLDGTRVDQVSR
ncbi:hypothetical protein OG874_14115 [Nocardia sp. NBC_00565]|uniref:hypothetical protein n=1 Tax=Nocardia sp. NBC_00565 TaxID=2975993 RepID=UPI002E80DB98|nr:hypothetical protein [Nocardia sp. NBC_00565]WUC06196.1 hypothetical protein OG874_14115 [Nocardia sp. NBC_00565]